MAVRIRVYPQYGAMGGLGGAYGAPGAYGAQPLAHLQLQNEKKTNNLRLNYERALWSERLKTVQLQTAMQYGGAGGAMGAYGMPRVMMPYGGMNAAWTGGMGLNALGMNPFGMGIGMFGSLGLGGLFG